MQKKTIEIIDHERNIRVHFSGNKGKNLPCDDELELGAGADTESCELGAVDVDFVVDLAVRGAIVVVGVVVSSVFVTDSSNAGAKAIIHQLSISLLWL